MKLIAGHAIFYVAKPNEQKNQSQLEASVAGGETPGLPGFDLKSTPPRKVMRKTTLR